MCYIKACDIINSTPKVRQETFGVLLIFDMVYSSVMFAGGLLHSQCVGDRYDGVGESVGSVGEAVLLQRKRTPAVYTSESHLAQVNAYLGDVGRFDFGEMGVGFFLSTVERVDCIVEGRRREWF